MNGSATAGAGDANGAFFSVVTMSVAMFAGAFLSGYLPMKLSASPRQLKLISIFGAGLLVSSALVIILPVSDGCSLNSSVAWQSFFCLRTAFPASPVTLGCFVFRNVMRPFASFASGNAHCCCQRSHAYGVPIFLTSWIDPAHMT